MFGCTVVITFDSRVRATVIRTRWIQCHGAQPDALLPWLIFRRLTNPPSGFAGAVLQGHLQVIQGVTNSVGRLEIFRLAGLVP